MKAHLIDGTYELFRAYFGAPGAKSAEGTEVGATRGLLRSFLALLQENGVTHVACAFDQVIESFRNELFAGYKTGEGIEPDLWNQFPLAERAARALGIVVWPMREFEADDALATAAARWGMTAGVEQIVICTPDKDLAQCVRGSEVIQLDRRRRIHYDENGVLEKFGVAPKSIPDWLALVGDRADGIPGIPRWGQRSAALVLREYEHLEAIPSDPSQWSVKVRGAAALAANLNAERENAELYRQLATLRTDVPLAEEFADLEWRGAYRDPLISLCEEIGETNLPSRVPRWRDDS